jgi:hypothetical protein
MTIQKYTVRKINLFPLAKFGCLLGGLAMLLPGMVCAFVGVQLIGALRTLLANWQGSQLEILGAGVPLDFIGLLGLESVQSLLIQLDEQSLAVGLLLILVSMLGGGLLIALTILLVGWAYNILAALTGGVEVELRV